MKKIVAILSLLLIPSSGFSQELEGTWNGNLEVQPGRKLLFIFQISKPTDKLESEIAIPGQGVKRIKPTLTTFEDSTLLLDASNVGFKYIGTWNDTSGNIEGTFQEGVNKVPLVLTKETIEVVKPNRRPLSQVFLFGRLVIINEKQGL